MKVFHVTIYDKVYWENCERKYPFIIVAENEEACRNHAINYMHSDGSMFTSPWLGNIKEIKMEAGNIVDARALV